MMVMRTYLAIRMARFKEWRATVLEDLSVEVVEEGGKTSLETGIMNQRKEVHQMVRIKTMFSTLGKSIQSLPKILARDQDRAAPMTRIQI